MSNFENYRTSFDYREILRILQKSTTLQENFLWQSHALGRNVIGVHHFEIDFVTREVVVYFDNQRFQLEDHLALYVKLDYRTSVFKVSQFKQVQNAIHFAFPTEIKTLELRSSPRLMFHPNQDKVISLKPSLSGNRESGNELQVRALDISEYGLGVLISENNRSFLKNNRILWVTKLGDMNLNYPLLAEVVYMNNEVDARFHNRKQRDLKVGIKLSGIFPSDIYQHFIL
jgi:hypothetical protein